MIFLLIQVGFISLSISMVISLNIQVQPQLFKVNEQKQVKLICSNFNQSKSPMNRMVRLRLRKLDDDGTWADVAILRYDGSTVISDGNATVHGSIGDVFKSVLNVTWPSAIPKFFGRYVCDAVGYNNMFDIVVDKSVELEVTGVTPQAFQLYELLEKSERNRQLDDRIMMETIIKSLGSKFNNLHELEEKILKSLNSRSNQIQENYVDNRTMESMKFLCSKFEESQEFKSLNSKLDQIQEVLNNKTLVIKNINIITEECISWPKGSFVLPMPHTGCPQTPTSWNKGMIRTKVAETDILYTPKFMPKPFLENNWVNLRFCGLEESPERNLPWPSGTYCIHQHHNKGCPSGLKETWIETRTSTTKVIELEPITDHNSGSKIGKFFLDFCCRHDGSHDLPIPLPKSSPFYLIRNQGKCQEVKDMSVKQDLVVIAAKDGKWNSKNKEGRPDANFNPLRLELCFYSKK